MKISSTAEIIIAVALIALVTMAFVFLLILPQFGALAEQDRQLAQANQDIQSAQNLLAQRQSAKTRAAQTQADLMKLENQIPDDPQLPSLIIELQNIANEAGLDFVKVNPTKPAVQDGYDTVPVSVVLQGRWADCTDYVRRLQKLDRQVRVLSVNLTPIQSPNISAEATNADADRNPPVDLSATINIEAYSISSVSTTSSAVPPPAGTP
jgi:type IV pilus assembly protein PilO